MNHTLRIAVRVAALWVASMSAIGAPLDATNGRSQPPTWQPPAPLTQTELWPEGHAITKPPVTGPESVRDESIVENVTRPTMTVFPPQGTNSGTAVVVFPGGGYRVVAMAGEGTEVCDWLTAKGITCVLLKYRVPTSGPQWDGSCDCRREPSVHMALQDAQRAIRLIRQAASGLHIAPNKVGVIGFSAGGNMVADVSNASGRNYTPVDDADKLSARPDFAMALYPGRLWEGKGVVLNPTLHLSVKTPPTFLVQAEDDPVDNVRNSIAYYLALKEASVPVEMHLYASGGHAFGLREKDMPIGAWPQLAEKWMQSIGMIPPG
ncbi:MAG TPA: alpha/beta hydrolase [Luteibacter sp.]|nr:alpha/beta hydrolase [Luteibacter sp.]HVI55140.1 alpha/beta hydrolase [Luteibacter sp.]